MTKSRGIRDAHIPHTSQSGRVADDPVTKRKKHFEQIRKSKKPPGPKTQARMRKFLSFRYEGDTVEEACARIGVTTSAYIQWRKQDPAFKADADRVTARLREGWDSPETPFDATWREHYFGHIYRSKPVTPWHLQVLIDFVNSVKGGETALVLMPPEHAKSTLAEDYLCHQIATFPNLRTAIISKGQFHAKKLLGRVQERMTDRDLYDRFHTDYGPFKDEARKGRPWSTSHFKVARNDGGERDYSCQATGFRGQIYGSRLDLIFIDDIVDPNEPQTPEMTSKIVDWVRGAVYSRVGTEGRLIMVGTRVDEEDVYKVLMDEGFFDKTLILPVYDEECSDGRPHPYLWTERFSEVQYERMEAKQGDRLWALLYMQADSVDKGMTFPRSVVEGCYAFDRRAQLVPNGWIPVAGVDPAAAGFTAGIAYAIDPRTELRQVIDVWNVKDLTGDGGDRQAGLVQFILEVCSQYGAKHLGLEENSAWTLLSSSIPLRRELSALGVTIHRVITKTGGTVQGSQEDLEISQLSNLFFNNMVLLPAQGTAKQLMAPFVQQLSRWKPGDKKRPKDLVKAFQFAEYAARRVLVSHEGPPPVDLRAPNYIKRQQREIAAPRR